MAPVVPSAALVRHALRNSEPSPWHGLTALLATILLGCSRGEPPGAASPGTDSRGSTTLAQAPETMPGATRAHAAPVDSGAETEAPDAMPAELSAPTDPNDPAELAKLAVPALTDQDGKPLPQTEQRPKTDSPGFQARMALLFRAITSDNPELGAPAFFPLLAYQLVKDVQKPERDWQYRLMRNFARDIHAYHEKLGQRAADARLVRVEVPEERALWMKPGREGNRIGYYRVLRSTLVYDDGAGHTGRVGITSLISWRGEWYVVHVDGFE
ncbi:MAG: hypothetical protein JW940_07500 [Polyangiaceae bacterium]|nr:hypothetical protein [Polyangiaceae bacterium]